MARRKPRPSARNPNKNKPSTSYDEVADLFVGKLDIPELKDAKLAGSPSSESCTLILTEGDSAKIFAMSGDTYGVFPLRGKLLNVRDASPQQLLENAEIQNIKEILGLQVGKTYDNVKELRYGHLMIMADQDHGSLHIIGLLINFLHYFWPSLLKVKSFMRVCITPIVKAASEKKTNDVSLFYTMPEYKKWQKNLGKKVIQYKIKYFEGPETIEREEREEYLDQHVKEFLWIDDLDGREIEIAFSKKIEVIREWLRSQQRGETRSYLDSEKKHIRYRDFISIDFKQYVKADLQRSIPSMVDGLKPGQRKILFYAFKKPIIQEIEVAQFSTYVFEHSPYHHGEESLVGTIIGMAQNYVGSNNINLLQPNGQFFGTRLMGGKDHDASGRCLFTRLSPITRYLFPEDDELILHYTGRSPEPAWFYPIIPMHLVNGSEGRGTVCSSFIPNYNPRDIISNIKRLLNNEAVETMLPCYNGFKGKIEKTETPSKDTLYTTNGMIEVDNNGITITELPVGTWTKVYEKSLKSLVGNDIKAYTPRHGKTNNVHFEITMTNEQMKSAEEGGILNKFKLTTTLSTANMHMLDLDDQLIKYDTPDEILEDFYHFRLKVYEKRRSAWLYELKVALLLLENKKNLICKVRDADYLVLPPKEKEERCAELMKKGFQSSQAIAYEVYPYGRKATKEEELKTGYDYLLSTPIVSFSDEKIKELEKEISAKTIKLRELENTSAKSLWLKDLDALIRQLDAEKYPYSKTSTRCSQTTKGELEESF